MCVLIVKIKWRWITISKELKINEEIRAKEVRLIGVNNEQVGVVPLRDALRVAHENNMDLVEIAPTAKPP
ncbi:MAG: translation initiation factor IF-3, partial [Bacillota bacterium]